MAVVAGLLQGIGDAGAQPLRRVAGKAERDRDLVGGEEADAADVAGEAVGVLADEADGVGAERPIDPRRLAEAKAVLLQEDAEVADDAVLRPALGDAADAGLGEADDLLEPVGL